MFNSIHSTTPLQIFDEVMIQFKVIFKSLADPDDKSQVNLKTCMG